MPQRLIIFGVLVIVLVSSIFSVVNVQSQVATTFTSYETSISPLTSTSAGYVTVGTVYTTSPLLLFSGPFTISSAGKYGCWVEHFPFTGIGGQVLTISISSDRAISFYVMTEASYNDWNALGQCDSIIPLTGEVGITFYQNNVVIPYNSTFEFLFLNLDKIHSASVEFDVGYFGQSTSTTIASTILTLTTQTVTSQIPITATESGVFTYSTSPTELTSPPTLPPVTSLTPYLIVVVIAMIGVVGLLYFWGGNRRSRQQTKLSQFTKTGERRNHGRQFCVSCGNSLVIGSKFCNKCGAEQQPL